MGYLVGNTAPGKEKNTGGKFTTSDNAKARDAAGKAVGVSGNKGVENLPHLNSSARDAAGKAVGVSGNKVVENLPQAQSARDAAGEDGEAERQTKRTVAQ